MRSVLTALVLGILLGLMPGCREEEVPPPPPKRKAVNVQKAPKEEQKEEEASSATQQAARPAAVPEADAPIPPLAASELLPGLTLSSLETQSLARLRAMAAAFAAYHQKVDHYPAAAIRGVDKPLLSWRVALLPYLGQAKLFQQFNLAEPWDSPANKPLVARIPLVYQTPGRAVDGKTCYLVPVGQGTVFGQRQGITEGAISDGKDKTLLVVEADESRAVPWTQPEELVFSAVEPLSGLGGLRHGRFLGAFGDGKVRAFPTSLDEPLIQALFSAQGGEPLELAALDRAIVRLQRGSSGDNSSVAKPGERSNRLNEALQMLARGDSGRGMELLHAEVARGNWDVVTSMRWSKALKRPMFVLRCGIVFQAPGASDSAGSRGASKTAPTMPPSTADALAFWRNEIGLPVTQKIQTCVQANRLGVWLRESVRGAWPTASKGRGPSDKLRASPYTNERGVFRFNYMDATQAKRLAAKEGFDVLIAGTISVKNVRVHGDFVNQSTLLLRMIDVARDEVLWSSKPLVSDVLGVDRTASDPVVLNRTRALEDLLGMLEEEVFLDEMPKFTPEIIQRRADALVEQITDPWQVLAELRYYGTAKLLGPDQLATYFSKVAGNELGPALANGSEVAKEKAVDKLLETLGRE